MRKLKYFSSLIIALILFSACSNISSTTNSTTDAYPVSDSLSSTGNVYPAGQEPTTIVSEKAKEPIPEMQSIPVPNSEAASVYGVLNSYSDKSPLEGVIIYAADVVIVEPSKEKIYSTQEKSSPHAGTDVHGRFQITDIKPGEYFFMMVTPFGTYPIFDEFNNTFEIQLKAGDVIDFGEVFVNWP